jgi:S1-C subfamily serine protease
MDLAILLFRTPTKQPTVELDFARKLCIGNEIFHFGCGMGEDPRLELGRVTSLKGKVGKHTTDVYRTSVFTIFGDSGGPTFYKNNKVIGMTQAIKVTTFRGFPAMLNNISMVIPIGAFKTWDAMENQTLSFIHNPKTGLPRLPYATLGWQTIDWEKIEHDEGE